MGGSFGCSWLKRCRFYTERQLQDNFIFPEAVIYRRVPCMGHASPINGTRESHQWDKALNIFISIDCCYLFCCHCHSQLFTEASSKLILKIGCQYVLTQLRTQSISISTGRSLGSTLVDCDFPFPLQPTAYGRRSHSIRLDRTASYIPQRCSLPAPANLSRP